MFRGNALRLHFTRLCGHIRPLKSQALHGKSRFPSGMTTRKATIKKYVVVRYNRDTIYMATAKKQKTEWVRPAKLTELAELRYQLRRFLSFSEMASEAAGISAQQYQLLQVIAAVPAGQECSISYIAARMVVRHNSAVELVDRAEKAELVRRVADARDHRRSLVEITARGKELVAQLVAQHLIEIEVLGPELSRTLQRLLGAKPALARKSGER